MSGPTSSNLPLRRHPDGRVILVVAVVLLLCARQFPLRALIVVALRVVFLVVLLLRFASALVTQLPTYTSNPDEK